MTEDEAEGYVRIRRFPGSHLSSPLTYYPQVLVLQGFENKSRSKFKNVNDEISNLTFIKRMKKNRHVKLNIDPSYVYARFFQSTYSGSTWHSDKAKETNFHNLLVGAIKEIKSNIETLANRNSGIKGMKVELTAAHVTSVSKKMFPAYNAYRFTSRVRSAMQQSHVSNDRSLSKLNVFEDLDIYHSHEMVYVFYGTDKRVGVLMNYDQWIMVADTVASRLLSLMTVALNDCKSYDILPSWKLLTDVYRWGDVMISEKGMPAYSVIGEFESMVTALFVTFGETDVLGLGNSFYRSVLENADEIRAEHNIETKYTVQLLAILGKVNSVNVLSELFGLRKHWGNPIVDAAASGKAVQEKLNEDLPVDPVAMLNLHASFNRMITLEYIKKHQVWPRCFFPEVGEKPCPIRDAWKNRIIRIPETHPDHHHLHWGLLTFHQNCVLQDYKDQLSTLADKAVSLPSDELDKTYFQSQHRGERSEHQRRLILEYLRKDHMTIKEILKTVQCGSVPFEWLANTASMKGTEVKYRNARIFAVLTFEMRQYFSVTEDMIKEHIFPYNPHQTMTMSEVSLLQRLRDITKQMDVTSTSRTLNVIHIIDFSKWNLRMKFKNTALIFRTIDDFMGTPALIESSHILFEQMTNIVQDPYNDPEQPVSETESDTIWRLHNRGWEGQRQKGWTNGTSALLADVERKTGIRSTITGQGDNQVMLTQFPIPAGFKNASEWVNKKPDLVKEVLDNYYSNLEESCNAIGLKIKTAETCRSLHYLNYGKRLYFNGVELSMSLKRIAKILTEPNDAFPTSESRLKTAQGAAYAAGLFSHPSPWPAIMSRFSTNLILWESFTNNPISGDFGLKDYQSFGEFSPRTINILTKIPHSLGGPPQQPFASFLCRGHPDPLCEDLVMLTLRARQGCKVSRSVLKCAEEGLWFEEENADKSSLIFAPYSLNLSTPTSAKNPVSAQVLPALVSVCKNTSVLEVLSFEVTNYEDELCNMLSGIDPFNPLIANDIFSRSVPGQRQSFVNGLKNSTSLCRLVTGTQHQMIINEILRLELAQLRFWINQIKNVSSKIGTEHFIKRHHVLAQEFREKSWNTSIVGVTVPHPLELFEICESETDLCKDHVAYKNEEHLAIVRHSDELFSPFGGDSSKHQVTRSRTGTPYLGNTISEGLFSKQIVCKTRDKSWEDACRLNVVRRWITEPGSNLDLAMKEVIATRTDADVELLNLVTGQPCRSSYTHRANLTAVKKTCAVVSTTNMMTRLYISSNRMGEYSSGDINYHLAYGPTFVVFGTLLCWDGILNPEHNWNTVRTNIFHCHLTEADIPVVYDGTIECKDKSKAVMMTPPNQLYVSINDLVFEDISERCRNFFTKTMSDANIMESKIAYGYVLLGDSLVREISFKELGSTTLLSSFSIRSSTITTSDIKLTGIFGLVRAISTMLLINSPIDTFFLQTMSQFVVSFKLLCDNLSDKFWHQFTNVMIHSPVIAKLQKMAGNNIQHFETSSTDSLTDLFKTTVCIDGWNLFSSVKSLKYNVLNRAFILAVPNDSSARHLVGRLFTILLWVMCKDVGFGKSDTLREVRKLTKDVHNNQLCPSLLSIRNSLNQRIDDFFSSKLLLCKLKMLPEVVILNLNEPWVDRLRDVSIPFLVVSQRRSAFKVSQESLIPTSLCVMHVGSEEGFYKHDICKCDIKSVIKDPQLDYFYLRSGIFSSLHYPVLDAVALRTLDIRGVLTVGDKEGEIGGYLSLYPECQRIYVSSTKQITSFSPHTAANCIPTAFSLFGDASKLMEDSHTGLLGNPISDHGSLKRTVKRVKNHLLTGLIINYIHKDAHRQLMDGNLYNLIEEFAYNVGALKWCCVVFRAKCYHSLQMAISAVAGAFEIVSVFKSMIHRESANVIVIVGERRRLTGIIGDSGSSLISLLSSTKIQDLVTVSSGKLLPPLMRLDASIQEKWITKYLSLPTNFPAMCDSYISGWGTLYSDKCEAIVLIKDLNDIKQRLKAELNQIDRVKENSLKGGRMPRSDVLSLVNTQSNDQIQTAMNMWLRCVILVELLKVDLCDVDNLLETFGLLLNREYFVTIRGKSIRVDFHASAYKAKYSSALFCIIGHVWQIGFSGRLAVENVHMTHISNRHISSHDEYLFPILLPEKLGFVPYPTRKYLWVNRAKLNAILLTTVHYGVVPIVSDNLKEHKSKLIDMAIEKDDDFSTMTAQNDLILLWMIGSLENLEWIEDIQTMLSSKDGMRVLLVVNSVDYKVVRKYLKISSRIRVPWSGAVPTLILVNVSGVQDYSIDPKEFNVDYTETLNTVYSLDTKTGCNCYDCVTEYYCCGSLNLTMSDVSSLCKQVKSESVDDFNHHFK